MRAFMLVLIVLVLVVFGVIIFHHPQSSGPKAPVSTKNLKDYANTAADVKVTIDGPINGDDVHRQVVITVNASERTINIIGGYNGNVISSKSYANNPQAFKIFLESLQLAGFSKAHSTSVTDFEGFCPQDQRYYYQLENTGDSKADFFLWGSACGNGTEGGQGPLIRQLFSAQISDYDTIVSGVNL